MFLTVIVLLLPFITIASTPLLFLLRDIALDDIVRLKVFKFQQTNTTLVSFLNAIDFRLQHKSKHEYT